ncbi:MAG: C10 family peptidase, partial [Bacteroidota bacterium]
MKSLLFLGLSLLLAGQMAFAEKIPEQLAREVALNAYLERLPVHLKGDKAIQLTEPSEVSVDGRILYYIFNVRNDRGFVIVSADDRVTPLLAYSYTGTYIPGKTPAPAFSWFMNHLKEQILYVLDQHLPATKETTEAWRGLSDPASPFMNRISGVDPMVQTSWDQGCYYNEDCPDDSSASIFCYHAPAGCGATAMAQILKFWRAPLHGVGAHSYFDPTYGNLSANFGAATYQYSAMPAELTTHNQEVAQLMYHCGVAQEMDYGPTISSSYSSAVDAALSTFFDYNAAINWKWKGSYTSDQWNSLLTGELDAGRPLIYYGNHNGQDGRFFICDGYQGNDFFHFNWGWGGYLDGYFYSNDLTPGSNNFNSNQGAVFDIIPNQIPPPPVDVTMDFENITDFSLTFDPWSVADEDGSLTYQITNHTFPHSGEKMAFICFNPTQVSPPMNADPEIQPHTGNRFGACFSATTPPNDDWFISPRVQLQTGGVFSFWVKSYTADYGLERYKVGVSTTGTNPGDFTFISGSVYLEAPTQWTKQTFDLSAYDNQAAYVAIQSVSNDAFIFMIDDLEVYPGSQGGLPTYMTLDFENLQDFTTEFSPWTVEDINGGNTYGIENISYPHSGQPFAYICFNPQQTTPPMTNMSAHSGSRLGACFSSIPPNNPNNKWLISPKIQLGGNPAMSLWVQSYSEQYGLEKFNIGVSTTGNDPVDFILVNTGGPESAPDSWTRKTFNLDAFANQAAYLGIQ